MKKALALALMILLVAVAAEARDTHVNGYTRKDGTYVQPHYRTAPNNTSSDNYSTRGNTNPYTGEPGYKDPNDTNSSSPFATTPSNR